MVGAINVMSGQKGSSKVGAISNLSALRVQKGSSKLGAITNLSALLVLSMSLP